MKEEQKLTIVRLPEHVEYIINELMRQGYEAYAVGGCVRDTLLHRIPGDWDITTSAAPEEVKRIFKRTVDTGIEHGTVTVMIDKCGYEVTTYRIDGEYEDGRHPKSVEFTTNLTEDLKRRDFTINAMAYNHKAGLVDVFDGIGDLERGLIRCVGRAEERFMEDALRMLRAVRFAAQLGFSIEEETIGAIRRLSPKLSKISRERIQAELTKLLRSPHPELVDLLFSLGLINAVLPELAQSYAQAETEEMLLRLSQTANDTILRYTVFLSVVKDVPARRRERTRAILRELKFDNHTTEYVSRLSEWRDVKLSREKADLRRQIVAMGEDIVPFLLKLQGAEEAEALYREIKQSGECLSIKELAVNGRDLIGAGIEAGKPVGATLSWLLEQVLAHPELNDRETLMTLVRHGM